MLFPLNFILWLLVLLLQQTMMSTSTAITTAASTQASAGNFTNPVLYEDFADNDIFLGPDGAFYYSASSFHYSPGAPTLKSYDLVNWEIIGHSVPSLVTLAAYNMTDGETAYRGGVWASTLRYWEKNNQWYWIGCLDFWTTLIYTAPDVTGPWTLRTEMAGNCYYDCGLLIDDDGTGYVVHGNTNVTLSQLSADGLSEVKAEQIFTTPSGVDGVEGNRMYKYNGTYYVLDDSPGSAVTYIWKADSPWGPWMPKIMGQDVLSPVTNGGYLDQGSLIETADGAWYFMSFSWAYPAGRLPVLAPVTWGSDGYPILDAPDNDWQLTYPYPLTPYPMPSWTGTDTFKGTSLGPAWEWNHNPDPTKYTVNDGLRLSTATVTTDLYKARNTLTHREHGPNPVATIIIDSTNSSDGDRAGLAAFRDWTAWIGIVRTGDNYTVDVVQGITQNQTDWSTLSLGTTVASVPISIPKLYLRGNMNASVSSDHNVAFCYSTDGIEFQSLGGTYTLDSTYYYFMGQRWGIFNYATEALGGSVLISSFTQE